MCRTLWIHVSFPQHHWWVGFETIHGLGEQLAWLLTLPFRMALPTGGRFSCIPICFAVYARRATQKLLPAAKTALLYLSSLPLLFECFELENCRVCFCQGQHCGAEDGPGATAAAALVQGHLSHPWKEPRKTKLVFFSAPQMILMCLQSRQPLDFQA